MNKCQNLLIVYFYTNDNGNFCSISFTTLVALLNLRTYTDMCNLVTFTNMLPLYPCKVPWLKIYHKIHNFVYSSV